MSNILNEIMKAMIAVVGILAILVGFYFGFAAITTALIPLGTASAVQATQIYTEASYNALMMIGAFVFASICATAYKH